jgi:hypothetical protein
MCHSLKPVEMQKVVSIVESHGAQFTFELCKALCTKCSIPYKEQNSFLVCYDFAKKHPEQLLMMDQPRCHVIRNEDDNLLIAEAAAGVERAACGFNTFMLKPHDLKGEALFNHMLQHRLNDTIAKSHIPSMYLGVEHSEAQLKEFGPDVKDLWKCNIINYARGDGAMMNLESQKLDKIGYVKSYGGMQNDPEWLHRLLHRVEFSQSLAAITVLEQQDKLHEKAALSEDLWTMAPAAKIKLLQKNNDVSKPTKKEIVSLLLTWFAVKEDPNKTVKW